MLKAYPSRTQLLILITDQKVSEPHILLLGVSLTPLRLHLPAELRDRQRDQLRVGGAPEGARPRPGHRAPE